MDKTKEKKRSQQKEYIMLGAVATTALVFGGWIPALAVATAHTIAMGVLH